MHASVFDIRVSNRYVQKKNAFLFEIEIKEITAALMMTFFFDN